MHPAFVIILVTLWVSAFNLDDYMVLGEDSVSSAVLPSPTNCLDCTECENPCHPFPPPSPPRSGYSSYGAPPSPPSFSGYPLYGAPPPPPSVSTYPSYGAQPPPPPSSLSTNPSYGALPPPSRSVPVQCCQYPNHPNPDEYFQPLDNHSPTPYSPFSTFFIAVLLLSFAVLF